MIKIGHKDIKRVELVFEGRSELIHQGEVVVKRTERKRRRKGQIGPVWDPWTFIIHAQNPGEPRITVEEGALYIEDVMRDNMVFVVDPHAKVRGRVGKAILRATMTAAAKKRIVDLVEHGIGMDFSGHLGRSLQRAAAKQAADEAKYL